MQFNHVCHHHKGNVKYCISVLMWIILNMKVKLPASRTNLEYLPTPFLISGVAS